jgi:hypothetical protein
MPARTELDKRLREPTNPSQSAYFISTHVTVFLSRKPDRQTGSVTSSATAAFDDFAD